MIVNPGQTQQPPSVLGDNRLVRILIGSILLGFGWQIRGSGTSDPSVVILLFLLYLSVLYSPRKKFNMIVFAFVIYVFGSLRTGWGTFVAQAGIPGLYPGHIPPNYGEGYDLVVQWWQGYFWLLIVGFSWAGFPSLFFGGYFFTERKYTLKDLFVCVVLFMVGKFVGQLIAEQLIPLIAPQYYNEIYLTGLSRRNYTSMVGNMSTAIGIIPVLLYIWFHNKDKGFVVRSVVVMSLFAFALSIADIWQAIGRNNPAWELPFWSLWEYFTGFIFGGLVIWYYGRIPKEQWNASDIPTGLEPIAEMSRFDQFLIYSVALYHFLLYGLQESINGSIRVVSEQLKVESIASTHTVEAVIVVISLLLYYLYRQGTICPRLAKKSFREKSLILLIAMLPVYYLCFAMPHIVKGDLFQLSASNSAVWLDTISFVIVEIYGVYLYLKSRGTFITM